VALKASFSQTPPNRLKASNDDRIFESGWKMKKSRLRQSRVQLVEILGQRSSDGSVDGLFN
jgi:hypothetical protein